VQCAPRDANGLRIAPFFEHPAAAGYATVNTLGALDAPAAHRRRETREIFISMIAR
jgi:hypothetical protein